MNKIMSKILHLFAVSFIMGILLCLIGCGECFHTNLTETPVSPTCDTEGYTLCVCADCGLEYKKDVVAPTGHTMTSRTVASTCEEEGYTEYTCTCGYTYTSDTVAPGGHTLAVKQTVEPTCTTQGYTEYGCECGYTFVSDVIQPKGHSYQKTTVLPTCTAEGYTEYLCACGYSYRAESIRPLAHEMKTETVAPTCTAQGYTKYACATCSLAYTSDWTAPLGHEFSCEIMGPTTASHTAYNTYTCLVCEYTYRGDYLFYSDVFEGAYGASDVPVAHGLDVSKYNHEYADGQYKPLDFEVIRAAGFDFVILKIGSTPRAGEDGQVRGGMEPTFEADYEAAKAAGLDVGVYFYTYSLTPEDTVRDAELVLEWLEGKTLDYPIYFDMEDASFDTLSRKEVTDLCVTFISTLQQKRWFGALYTNNHWLVNRLQNDKVTFLFDIWYARYPAGEGPFEWNTEKYGEQMGMWQYTQTGKIPSLSEKLTFDFNYAYKDYPTIIQGLGYNGFDQPQNP